MAKNKQPLKVDLEERSQGTIATSSETKQILDQEEEPITENQSRPVNVPLVKALSASGTFEATFLWPSSVNHKYCCIYRVPYLLRTMNPEAYTSQMLLIGPLHHSKKILAAELSKTDSRYLDYMKMERHKKNYLENFKLCYGNQNVKEFRRIIQRDEKIIRACFAESTDCINSHEFVEMMLLDSVFILVFFLQLGPRYIHKTGDFVFDVPFYKHIIKKDLLLLENQLPYFLLENLFEPFLANYGSNSTFREIILEGFGFFGEIKREVKFQHFTDLLRRVRVETLGITSEEENTAKLKTKKIIQNLPNANKLDSAGVRFEVFKDERLSLEIKFEDGILKMPFFVAEDSTEKILRNIMALEQCHYPYTAYVCSYIEFLDLLIDTEKDVNLLVEKGVIKNNLGHEGSVSNMVNKLCLGIIDHGSNYYHIAKNLDNHYKNPLNRSFATLQQVYFKDLWTGTATIAAVIIIVLTLIGTLASVLQVKQNDNKSPLPPPAPTRKP